MLTLLTKPPKRASTIPRYGRDWLEYLVKKQLFLTGIRHRRFLYFSGPDAVVGSLARGFTRKHVPFLLNPWESRVSEIACVICGVDTLKWAVVAKRLNKVKYLIAGPNIVVAPSQEGGILFDDAIDLVVTNSPWTRSFYASLREGFGDKIRIWAAGVSSEIYKGNRTPEFVLVFRKTVPDEIYQLVVRELSARRLRYRVLEYGRYTPRGYAKLLSRSRFMIYLTESESQGISLHEAWMADVPTLVWRRGYWKWKEYEWQGETTAPYMTPECGMGFDDTREFPVVLSEFVQNLPRFRPRLYSLSNFTDEISAANYLKIVSELVPTFEIR